MRLIQRFMVLASVLLLVSVPLVAQTTGTLTGTVRQDGSPLPGALVTISSPSLQGVRTTYTDINGNYTFGAVPPGGYSVRIEMEGLETVTRTTRVGVAQQARVNADLRISGLTEAITVTASAPAVLETQEVQTNIQADLVEALPTSRTLAGTANLAPGVTNNGPNNGIVISGAYSYDNLFLVNGAITNENVRGQSHNLFIEDAIQETTVMTGGISAEYGHFTGGVVSALTKSGGNEFSGSIRDTLTNPSWTELTPHPGQPEPIDNINEVYEATLGGRIIRDRLWFFTAGRFYETETERFFTRTTTPFVQADEERRLEGKLTGAITPAHSLVASYLDVLTEQTSYCFISCLEPSNLDASRSLPNDFMVLQYNGIFGNSFLLEANYSQKHFTFQDSGGDKRDRVNGTAAWDAAVTGGFFGAPVFCGVCDPENRDNEAYSLKGTYYLATPSLGTHNIVGGYERFAQQRTSNNYQSGSNFFISVYSVDPRDPASGQIRPVFTEGDALEYFPILQLSQGSDLGTDSFFVNDRWDLNNRLSFNLGARYDRNDAYDSSGALIADDANVSPRVGVTWDLAGNGRNRVNASFSRYVAAIAETVGGSTSVAGRPAYFAWYYDGPTINEDRTLTTTQVMERIFAWFDSRGGLDGFSPDYRSIPGVSTAFNGTLNTPNVDEFVVGFGTQLGTRGFARVDYINREYANFYTSRADTSTGRVTDASGRTFDLTFIENSDDFQRNYDGIQLQAGYRLFNRLNLGGNYTWSETTGNSEGESAGGGPGTESSSYPEFQGFERNRPIGFLSPDQTHKLRAWVSYDQPTPIGVFNFSVLQRFDSGRPYSASQQILVWGSDFAARGYEGGVDRSTGNYVNPTRFPTYFFSDRGEFRWDDINATDVAINYALPISRVNLFVQAEMFNAFDNDAQTFGDSTIRTARTGRCTQTVGANAGSPCAPFNPFTETPQEGVHWQKGPNFGNATAVTHYQTPRSYQFSVGARF